jgi:putative DNA primase/helicase
MTSFDSTTATDAELGSKQFEVDGFRNSKLMVECAADIKPERVEFLWPGRIAIGKQSLLAGEAGLGKSQITIAMAAAVTTGGPWPCGEGNAPLGSVVFLCAEDGAGDTVVPRLMAAGADLNKVYIVTAVRGDDGKGRRAFNLQSDLEHLEAKIREIGDVRLVPIDPISSYLGPKIDSHVNAAVRGVLEPVGEMASRLRVAVVSVTHPPKGTGTTAINRFIGSIAFVAAARSAFMVTRDAEDADRRLFLPVKNNLAPLGKGFAVRLEQRIVGEPAKGIVASAVAWETSPIDISADAALQAADAQSSGNVSAGTEAEEFLRDILSAGPVPQKEIKDAAEGHGLAWSTIKRAKARLGIQARKDGMEGGWSWSLPKGLILPEEVHLKGMGPFEGDEPLRNGGPPLWADDGLEIPEFLRRY